MAELPLTEAEKQLISYHLGYPLADSTTRVGMGVPGPTKMGFLVQGQLGLVPDGLLPKARRLLCLLESVELAIQGSLDELSAEQMGNMKLRGAEKGQTVTDLKEREYCRWAQRLADLLGVPLYPYAKRFSGSRTGNIPVSGPR